MARVDIAIPAYITGSDQIFGAGYTYTKSTDLFSTTAPIFQTAIGITTDVLDAGKYRMGWSYIWSSDSVHNNINVRIRLDNTVELLDPNLFQEIGSSTGTGLGGTDQRVLSTGTNVVDIEAGVHDIDIEARTTEAGWAVSIYTVVFELWRVA